VTVVTSGRDYQVGWLCNASQTLRKYPELGNAARTTFKSRLAALVGGMDLYLGLVRT